VFWTYNKRHIDMFGLFLLIIGVVYAIQRPALRRLSAKDYPNVEPETFTIWHNAQLKAVNTLVWGVWGIFGISLIANSVFAVTTGLAFVYLLTIVLTVIQLAVLILIAVYAAEARKLRKAANIPPWIHINVPMSLSGVAIHVIGLIVFVAGAAKIVPGGIWTGAAFAIWGVLLYAFGFIPPPEVKGDEEPPMSGVQKLIGIFYEPTRVFGNLRAHPHWLAAFLVIVIVNAAYATAFEQRLTPERIVDATMNKIEQSFLKPPPEAMARAREDALQQAKQPIQRVQTVAKSFVGIFVLVCFVAALCLLGVLAFGGRMNFWQAFAAVFYSYLPIAVIGKLISTVILFIKSPEDIHPLLGQETLVQDNLGILFSPAEHPVLFVLGTAIGVLSFYGLWLKAKGLANAGHKVSSTAAWGVSITLWVLSLIIGLIFASLFPSLMS
jgi:hypothetical protein